MTNKSLRDYINLIETAQQGVAEGYDPVESNYQHWEDILVNDGYRFEPSGADALELVVGHQRMSDPAEVASIIRNILTYVKQNRQVLGKAVSDRKTVKDAIIDIKREFPQLYQAAQQQGVAEGLFGIDDKIKGRIQNIVSDLSDIPGMWDHKAQTFTDAGMDKLKTVLKNNPKYIKYALNLTYKDYEAEGVAEDKK